MMVAACAVVALAAFAKTPEEVPKEHRYPDAAQGGEFNGKSLRVRREGRTLVIRSM